MFAVAMFCLFNAGLRSNPVSVVKLLAAIAAVMALGACGGSIDAPLAGTPPTDTPLTGTFIDSPVEGIGYRTESIASGATDSQGQFSYLAGESVTFFIGDLDFPTTPAVEVVTPFDLAGTTDVTDPTVINIARLLQSLDENGNPDDGITIPDVAAAVATQIDFSQLPADFEADALNFIANAGSVNVSLISEAEAIAHLTGSVLTPVGGTEVWGANGGTIGFVATDSSQQQAADLGRISGTEVVLVYPFVSNTGFYRITNLVWNQGDDSIRMYNRASADSCDPVFITMMDTHISQTPEINGGGATSIVVDHGSFFELITPNLEGDSPPVTNDLWIEGACTPGAIQEDRVSVTRLILQGYGTPFTTETSTARVIEDATGTVVTAAPGDLHFWSVGGFDFFVEFELPEPNPLTPREDLPITLEIPFSFNGLANCSPVGPNDVWVVDVLREK